MTAARPCVLSAKVPLDLRQSVEALAQREGHGEVSIIIRRACRELVDRELARQAGGNLLDGPGTARRRAVGPEAQAALRVASRAGTARRLALEEFERVGASGLTVTVDRGSDGGVIISVGALVVVLLTIGALLRLGL
jgi:triphosphoribosyl-dephospho-CoA synthetase